MAKITRITTQKKHKNRYNIYLDYGDGEDYGFSVDEDVLVKYRLQKNMELDKPTIEALIQTDDVHKSFTLALNYLSYRMRSEKEIRDYLHKKEVESEHVDEVVERLKDHQLLDDQEFANSLVRTRVNTSSKGPLLVKKELQEKGIHVSQAEEALQYYPYDKQYEKAMKFAEKKAKSEARKSFKQLVQTIQQNLAQKGFKGEVIQEVLANLPGEDEDSEWTAAEFQGEKLLRKHARKYSGFELKQKVKSGLYRKGFDREVIDRFIEEKCDE
ncbi:recombination regulator RecX [Halobacillus salinarum]|uniref:Regulatory protein RecX n=1 Tax=Halobacillus salinarum TaxID=2932257 RepID=A0ABY4EHP4_9BACI|nr:recombination regulator RecX [Halobacillus salinarum]UOQ43669.1 recombination regulator RecX [Halobacillus salinarum]